MSKLLVIAANNEAAKRIIDSLKLDMDKIQVVTSESCSRSVVDKGIEIGSEFISDCSSYATRVIQGKPITPCKDTSVYQETPNEVSAKEMDKDILYLTNFVGALADRENKAMEKEMTDAKKGIFTENEPEHPVIEALNDCFDEINKGILSPENIIHTAAYLLIYAKHKGFYVPEVNIVDNKDE